MLDLGKIGTNTGLDVRTIKRYLSILEQTFVIHLLPAFSINVEKKVAKSPKVVFYDNGILSYLLTVTNLKYYERLDWVGKVFENAILSELIKHIKNRPLPVGIYFWRTYSGSEVDCVVETEGSLIPLEIKWTTTIDERDWAGLKSFQRGFSRRVPHGYILYRGLEVIDHSSGMFTAIPYYMIFL